MLYSDSTYQITLKIRYETFEKNGQMDVAQGLNFKNQPGKFKLYVK